jgi:excisionase family DNA binding protein
MNKKQAIEILGVSEKTLGNYARAGRLNVTYEKGATSKVAVYDEAELRALKAEIDNPATPANVARVVKAVEVESPAKVEHGKGGNSSNRAKVENGANVATLVKAENRVPDGVGQVAEFAALVGGHIAAGIAESLNIQKLSTQPLLTFQEAATYSRVPEKTLRDAVKAGEIQSRKIGRGFKVRRVDVDTWIEKLYQ